MKQKLKVLLLENNPNDAVLVSREIRDVAIVDVAINGKMFREMIREKWDVILVDLALEDIRGEEAIRLVREKQRGTPVIIVTGSVGDREANVACEAGASRFFLKDRLAGLSKAIVQAHKSARTESQELRDQRLEILGQLSAGIVHDTNNALAVMMMGIEQLRGRVDEKDERILEAMLSACKRCSEMTAQVLTFARGANGSAFKSVSVTYLLGEIGQLVRSTFPANIRLEIKSAPGTSAVMCDATQIVQALTNLAVNSRDAMPNGGTLTIEAQNVARTNEVPAPSVLITVSDTGTGIPVEIQSLVWEPFFSSKEPGFGTGLGLPTVKRIIEAHHGSVEFLTGPDGTSFFVHLPTAIASSGSSEGGNESMNGNGKCVLLVDDERFLREMMGDVLESANYKVILAANGPEALSFFRGPQQIDVLLSDQNMSLMTGSELVKNLRSVNIRIPVVMMTGFDAATALDIEIDARLQKPISREKLLSTIKHVLTQ